MLHRSPWSRTHVGELAALGWSALVVALSSALAVAVLQLWKADLRVPFDYSADAITNAQLFKSLIDHGSWLHNPDLGAPFGLDTHDFPSFEVLHLAVIRALAVFTHDHWLLLNLYFLLSFPAIALAMFLVLRHLRIGIGSAIVASVLYTSLSVHFCKGEFHLFLASYWQVPLALLVLMWTSAERPPLFVVENERRLPRLDMRSRRSWGALLICGVIATTGLYYAFFTGFLLVVIGAWASLTRRRWTNVACAGVLLAAIGAGLAAQAAPAILYRRQHGANSQVAQRSPGESEIYGLKLAQLVLPISDHRLAPFAKLRARYDASAPLVNENEYTSLGVFGTVGLLLLLGRLFAQRRDGFREDAWRSLGLLNLSALLLGTIGGLGTLFALLVTPGIRGYSRISVFIGCFALTAIALALDWIRSRLPPTTLARSAWGAALVAMTSLGLYDQTTPLMVRPYAQRKAEFTSDRDFVGRIEAALPSGAAVFQLPYVTYPESPPLNKMADYDELRGSLHSRRLRWSYPVMRGREGDIWAPVVAQPPKRMIEALVEASFAGIYVDRAGYADGGAELEVALTKVLEEEPIVSSNARLAFFDLRAFADQYCAKQWDARRLCIDRLPLRVTYADGFYGPEEANGDHFQWCTGACEIEIINPGPGTRRVHLRGWVRSASASPFRLDLNHETFQVPIEGSVIDTALDVQKGTQRVRGTSDSPPIKVGVDPRQLSWRLDELTVADE